MFGKVSLIGCVIALLVPAAAQAQAVCDALRQVTAKAASLEELAGKPVTADRWQSRIAWPGFERCEVARVGDGLQYECANAAKDQADAVAAAKRIGKAITASCLGPDLKPDLKMVIDNLDHPVAPRSSFYIESLLTVSTPDAIVSVSAMGSPAMTADGLGTEHKVQLAIFRIKGEAEPAPAATSARQAGAVPPPQRFELSAKIFCDCLKRLDGEAVKGFEGILGRATDEDSWASRYTMPGGEACYISRFSSGPRYYTCRLFRTENRSEADRAVKIIADAAKSCLGKTLSFTRRERDDGGVILTGIRAGDIKPEIEIRLRSDDDWRVHFDIEQPE
ncbi:hypothetical protein [Sphingobium sp.]|uniref:hypothetical protein n=1 Tax=Sphingobium sp. TaxID=1912891 RepID=UPI0028BE7D7A|nr:hypothetical protein [Sphingobium sp.]